MRYFVLAADYDGTLAPFVTDRNQAYPYPGVRRVLGRILRSGTTDVVVVSGDKDFHQLVRDRVWLLNPGRGGPAAPGLA